jgi:hypothetical protein
VRGVKLDMGKKPFLKYATGAAAAYPELDKQAGELLSLQAECGRLSGLAAIFEFPQLVEPVAKVGGQAGGPVGQRMREWWAGQRRSCTAGKG